MNEPTKDTAPSSEPTKEELAHAAAYLARLAAADERLDENDDGTIIVRLIRPIRVDGSSCSRLTVGCVRVRDVRKSRHMSDDASADFYADALVTPTGAAADLELEDDYTAVLRAVQRQLGKYRASGARS